MKTIISCQIDTDLLTKLDELAKQAEANRSQLLRTAIERFLESQGVKAEGLHGKAVIS